MMYVGAGILLLVAVSGFAVVRTRDATAQVVTLGFYGLAMALMFFFFQAPDVALSQVTVGAVALPFMAMLAISRMKYRATAIEAQKAQKNLKQGGRGDEHD
jgi:energy-converting hydrogenase B subunit D